MGSEAIDFTTASGTPLYSALGTRRSTTGKYFKKRGDKPGLLERGAHFGSYKITNDFQRIAKNISGDELRDYCVQTIEDIVGKNGKLTISQNGNISVEVQGKNGGEKHLVYAGAERSRNHESITGGLETLSQVMSYESQGLLQNDFVFQIVFAPLDLDNEYDSSHSLNTSAVRKENGYEGIVYSVLTHGLSGDSSRVLVDKCKEVEEILYGDNISRESYNVACHTMMKAVLANLV